MDFTEPKQCYNNTLRLMGEMDGVFPVFGKTVVCGVPLDHAICGLERKDGTTAFFDPTGELLLNDRIDEISFVAFKAFRDDHEIDRLYGKGIFYDQRVFEWFRESQKHGQSHNQKLSKPKL